MGLSSTGLARLVKVVISVWVEEAVSEGRQQDGHWAVSDNMRGQGTLWPGVQATCSGYHGRKRGPLCCCDIGTWGFATVGESAPFSGAVGVLDDRPSTVLLPGQRQHQSGGLEDSVTVVVELCGWVHCCKRLRHAWTEHGTCRGPQLDGHLRHPRTQTAEPAGHGIVQLALLDSGTADKTLDAAPTNSAAAQ